jgi:HK97 family phage portal protein
MPINIQLRNPFKLLRDEVDNKLNRLFFQSVGQVQIPLDVKNRWAIETAFLHNPDVYSILSQQASKTSSIPYWVKKKTNEQDYKAYQFKQKNLTTDTLSLLRLLQSEKKALNSQEYKPLPLEKPNPLMGWNEFFQLTKIYFRGCGNVFWYVLRNESNQPIAIYVLPSHLMEIRLKPEAWSLNLESPILGYEIVYGQVSVPFLEEEVIHIKMPNPRWTFDAQQLYGQSPLTAAFLNAENQIQANKHLHKMFKSSGAFGFIYAKGDDLTPDQAEQFTQRIKEMDASKERMAKISGLAKEIGFQRISLANDELQPWTALAWDRKTIANVLGWPDELLNGDGKSGLGGSEAKEARKIALMDNIYPDLLLFQEALNIRFIQDFKGYEGYVLNFDISEMPEMQDDFAKMLEWADTAPISLNEVRELIKFERRDEEGMDDIWISRNKVRLSEAMITDDFFAVRPDETESI